MATIRDALNARLLEEWPLPDTESRSPRRPLYIAGELYDWVDNAQDLYRIKANEGGRSRYEHLLQAFADFRCDARPLAGDLHRVIPTSDGIWKFHPVGLRVFGWVPAPHAFVAVRIGRTEDCHGPRSIANALRKDVLAFAIRHGLQGTIQPGDASALFPPQV